MKQNLTIRNSVDENGNPAGGQVHGEGIQISWQDGPLGRGEKRLAPNGAFVEGVLQAAIVRLEFYQGSRFACAANQEALDHVRSALAALERRTADREARAVEGTHET